MNRPLTLWIVAVALTLVTVVYQRLTGPTHPLRIRVSVSGRVLNIRLDRAHAGPGDQVVTVPAGDESISGELLWRRFPTADTLTTVPLQREGDSLVGRLPHQPPAGKIEYAIRLRSGSETAMVPEDGTVVTRFRGEVPVFIVLPHILLIFLAMAFSNRAGLEALTGGNRLRKQTWTTIILLFLGGMIFGPLMQYHAFGDLWTGFPLGRDLTDNKTLVAFIAWLIALLKIRRDPRARWWAFAAALLTLGVYLIPHSLLGSELKYE